MCLVVVCVEAGFSQIWSYLALIVHHFSPNIVLKVQKHRNAEEDESIYPSWISTKELFISECQCQA